MSSQVTCLKLYHCKCRHHSLNLVLLTPDAVLFPPHYSLLYVLSLTPKALRDLYSYHTQPPTLNLSPTLPSLCTNTLAAFFCEQAMHAPTSGVSTCLLCLQCPFSSFLFLYRTLANLLASFMSSPKYQLPSERSSSVAPFSSCPQSFSASGSF